MGESARFQFLRPLGSERRISVACDTKAPEASRLVAVERIARATLSDAARKDLETRVRTVSDLAHPRIVGVRELAEQGSEVLVVSDFVDGEAFGSLLDPPEGAKRPGLELLLRVLMDALDALGSMHGHHDDDGKATPIIHGAITPAAILVDERGFVRLAHVCRGPRPSSAPEYTPPEVRSGQPTDVRTDVFGVGAILWRVLMGAKPRPAKIPATGVTPEVPWAEPLVDVVRGAVVDTREQRWPTAAAMAGEIRRASGERIAAAGEVGEYVKETFGERIKARRSVLTALDDEAPPPSSSEVVSMSDVEVVSPMTPRSPGAASKPPPAPPAAKASTSSAPPLPKKAAIARVALVKNPPKLIEADAVEATDEEPVPSSEVPLVKKKAASPAEPPPPLAELSDEEDEPEAAPAKPAPSPEALQRSAPTVPPAVRRRPPLATPRSLGTGALLLVTLGIGWWLGKQSAAPPEPARVEPVASVVCSCPSATAAAPPTATMASVAPKGTAGASSSQAPTSTPTSTSASTAVAVAPTPTPKPITPAVKPTAPPTPKPTTASTFAGGPRPTPVAATPPRPTTRTGSKPAYHPDSL